MTTLFSATLGGPLVKTAAFSYGVRKAMRGDGTRKAKTEQVMGRLFWFGIGVGVAVFAVVKARQLTRRPTPRRSASGSPTRRLGRRAGAATSPTGFELPWPSAKRSSARS